MFIRIYYRGCFKDITLSSPERFPIGCRTVNGFNIPGTDLIDEHIVLNYISGEWEAVCNGEVFLNGKKVKKEKLTPGKIFLLSRRYRISMLVIEDYPESEILMRLGNEISIGRDSSCNIVLESDVVSSKHAKIKKNGTEYRLTDTKSMNGTYVNSRAVEDCILTVGDEIVVGESKFIFIGDSLRLFGVKNVNAAQERSFSERKQGEPPLYKRFPRIVENVSEERITVNPSSAGSTDNELNWYKIIACPAVIAVMIFIFVLIGAPVLFVIALGIAMPVTGVISYLLEAKRKSSFDRGQIKEKKNYLETVKKQILDIKRNQLRIMLSVHPRTSDCYDLVKKMSVKMWERTCADSDFMLLRVGSGRKMADIRVECLGDEALTENRFPELYELVSQENLIIENAPVVCDIRNNCKVGIVGKTSEAYKLLKNMIAQAVTFHSYDDLMIMSALSENEENEWEWLRLLPHYCQCNLIEENDKYEIIFNEMKNRLSGERASSYCLFIIGETEIFENSEFADMVKRLNKYSNSGIIIVSEDGAASEMCNEIIEVNGENAVIYPRGQIEKGEKFKVDAVDYRMFDHIAREMSVIRIDNDMTVVIN